MQAAGAAAERRAACAYMPQRDLLLPWRDALGNAALALECQGVPRRRGAPARGAAVRALRARRVRARRGPPALSGGMRQRVAFLRTLLAGRPRAAARRALRRARRDHARRPAGVARRRARRRAAHGPAGDPRRRGGGLPGRPDRGAVAAARPRRRRASTVDLPRGRARVTDPGARRAQGARRWRRCGHDARRCSRSACSALFVLAWQGVASLDSVDDLTLASPVETFDALRDDWSLLMRQRLASRSSRCCSGWPSRSRPAWCSRVGDAPASGRCATPPTRCWSARRRSRSWCSRRSSCSPSTTASGPKLAIVALICFFPITVNLLDGLRSTPPELLKLMRSMGASRLRTLRTVELPAALPSLFSGLKVAATVSVIGAVFGEWAGADEGLGRLVLLGNNQLQTPRVYAGIVLLTADGRRRCSRSWPLAERVACPVEPKGTARMRTARAPAGRCSRRSRSPAAARRRTCSSRRARSRSS